MNKELRLEQESHALSTFFFPLATSLELAEGQGRLSAESRAKQAAILFDELIVEAGLLVVERAGEMMTVRRLSPGVLSPELLTGSRTIAPEDESGWAVRATGDGRIEVYFGDRLPPLEREDRRWPVEERFLAEFHTGVLEELASLNPDWVRAITIDSTRNGNIEIADAPIAHLGEPDDASEPVTLTADEAQEFLDRLGAAIERAREHEESFESMRRGPSLERRRVKIDGILADQFEVGARSALMLRSPFNITTGFRETAEQRALTPGVPGARALELIVPNLSQLPWEAILEFREHPGAVEARAQLHAFEEEATKQGPSNDVDYGTDVATEVTRALIAASRELAPKLPASIAKEVAASGVGFIPIIGQGASLVASAANVGKAIDDHQRRSRSWVAAILKLATHPVGRGS